MAQGNLILILGDQLTPEISSLKDANPEADRIFMAEVAAEATYVKHHPKKIIVEIDISEPFEKVIQDLSQIITKRK